ncbi:hypothetical protein Barb4_00473 [Bacteroidales bacterium Barb4]|nr:hypothetical protein Barb4_00473 [Bacteroidales bacterium Barb4]
MHKKAYMPVRDAEFYAWALRIYKDCTANKDLWELNAEQLAQFTLLLDKAEKSYRANSDPELKNRYTSTHKQQDFAELKRFLSLFTNTLEGNTKIPDAGIESMGLRPREHHAHHPRPVPEEAPSISVVNGQHREMSVYVGIPLHGHPAEYLRNKDYYGFLLKYRLEGETEWQYVQSTRLHLTLHFNDGDEGKIATIACAWFNSRLQHGPWSGELTERIN